MPPYKRRPKEFDYDGYFQKDRRTFAEKYWDYYARYNRVWPGEYGNDRIIRLPGDPCPYATQIFLEAEERLGLREQDETIVPAKKENADEPPVSVDSEVESHIENLGSGTSLPDSARAFFEPRMGADFSDVTVHTDSAAAETAEAVNARAFAQGNDIVFGKGEYHPETTAGKELLAHELAHVVQQQAPSTVLRTAREYPDTREQREFQSLKDAIYRVDKKLIEKFNNLTGRNWRSIAAALLPGGALAEYLYTRLEFAELNTELAPYGLKVDDLFRVITIVQNLAVTKAQTLIEKNIAIVDKETADYSGNTKGKLDGLFKLLTTTYGAMFDQADLLRARALKRLFSRYTAQLPAIARLVVELTPLKAVGAGALVDYIVSHVRIDEKDLAGVLAQFPPDLAEIITFQVLNMTDVRSLAMPLTASLPTYARLMSEYPEYAQARSIDDKAVRIMRLTDAKDYPVLADVHADFRSLARKYKVPNNREPFKAAVLALLQESREAGGKTLETLGEEPSRVWELVPLIQLVMAEQRMNRSDKTGSIIWDRVTDVQREKTIRSLGIAAMGIALGIAGLFTGGATWAGLALGAGMAIVSGIDLYFELDSYILQSNAARATLDAVLAEDPSAVGVALAMLWMLVSVIDVAAQGVKLARSIQAIRSARAMDEMQAAARQQYLVLKEAGLIQEGVTEAQFVERMTQAALSDLRGRAITPAVRNAFEGALREHGLLELPDLVRAGLLRIYSYDRAVGAGILKSFAGEPEVLSRLSLNALQNARLPQAFAELHNLLGEDAVYVLRYFGREGAATVDTLPEVLGGIRRSGIWDRESIKRILTNRNLHQVIIDSPIHAVGRLLGRGSTADLSRGTTLARNLKEKLAIEQAMANPTIGTRLRRLQMTDPRWPASEGWVKMQQVIESGGESINVHYLYNQITGMIDDFKIILPGARP